MYYIYKYVTRFAKTRIFKNLDFCIMVFCIPKAFVCSGIKSILQIGLELHG